MTESMTETEFRELARAAYDQIEAPFEDIDPDLIECTVAQGALTLTLPNGARWVLSQQPPVRQLWLAVASLGKAHHFNYDSQRKVWLDDKGEGLELKSYLAGLIKTHAGTAVRF